MKTLYIKISTGILFCILHFAFCIHVEAQTDTYKKNMSDQLMKNTFIFEGKIISSKQGVRMKGSDNKYYNFIPYLVQVTKVIKGDIKKGTVEVVGGIYGTGGEDNGKITHYICADGGPDDVIPPTEGIYFCDKEIPIKDTGTVNTNSKALNFSGWASMSNGEFKKDNKDALIDYFPTIAEFYAYISANYGVKIEP